MQNVLCCPRTLLYSAGRAETDAVVGALLFLYDLGLAVGKGTINVEFVKLTGGGG